MAETWTVERVGRLVTIKDANGETVAMVAKSADTEEHARLIEAAPKMADWVERVVQEYRAYAAIGRIPKRERELLADGLALLASIQGEQG